MAKIRINRAKQKLAAGEVVNAFLGVDEPEWIDLMGQTGFDVAWLEAEHGPVDYADIGDLTRACDLWGMTSLLRVGWAQPNLIYRALDRGAQAICVPHVNTRQEAELIVDSVKYAPIGHRGMYFTRQAHGVDDYLQHANEQTMIVVLIEDMRAVENLDWILQTEHIDVFHVASSDLAQSMGMLGGESRPQVQEVVDRAITRIVGAGRIAGVTAMAETAPHYIRLGARFLVTPVYRWLLEGAKHFLDAAKKA